MLIFRKPITVLYILFSIVVISLAFQNCSSPFESVGSSDSFGIGSGGSLSVNEAKSLEIFEKTLYPTIQQHCASCHGIVQEPFFATDDSLDSHRLIFQKEYVNVENPDNSYFAIKIRAGHNEFPIEMADEFVASITQWSDELKIAIEAPEEKPPEEENPPEEDSPVEEDPPEEEPPVEEAPPEENQEDMAKFSIINETILIPKCLSCHKPTSEGGFGLKDDYSTYETTLSTGSVVAGDASKSEMYKEVVNGKMPPGNALSSEDIELIKIWIDAGAKNN